MQSERMYQPAMFSYIYLVITFKSLLYHFCYLFGKLKFLFLLLSHVYTSGEDNRHKLAAKDWLRLTRKTDGRSLAWIPEPVKLDTHDEEKMNRVFVLPDHTLVIRDFHSCTFYSSWFIFQFSADRTAHALSSYCYLSVRSFVSD